MKIEIARNAGYCYGVRRAFSLVEEAVRQHGEEGPFYTLGPIIHNPQAVEMLKKEKGVHPVSSVDEVEEGVLIIRSHGVPPELVERARRKGIKVVDATCPFVKRAQRKAKELADEGYQVVILGEREHPEVIGIIGHAGGKAYVVEEPEDVERLPEMKRVGVVFQTTQEMESFGEILMGLLLKSEEMKAHNTICHAIRDQQTAARELAGRADLMLVLGGHNSGNTRRLLQICRDAGARAYHIETADEIEPEWLEGVELVGIAAGASTPDFIIEGVIERLKGLS
jgi:4-hydroxy-3-methylbut-2-enyl diphosphate reductase